MVAVKLMLTSTLKSIGPSSESAFPDKVITVELLFTNAFSNWLIMVASVILKIVLALAAWEIFKFVIVPITVLSNFKVPEGIVPAVFPVKSLYL